MKSIRLIKTHNESTYQILLDEGAIPFGSDTLIWTEDPLNPQRILDNKVVQIGPDDCTVLDVFVPNSPNEIRGDHPQADQLTSLFSDLWTAAFHWKER